MKDLALVGATIAGKYRVIKLLGQGGFGSVFLVEIVAGMVGEKLALKLLPAELSQDEKVKGQFLNEIRVAMRMVNKYIIQIRDIGETETGQLYYTMDYCPGETLAVVLKREGRLPPLRAIPVVLRVLEALKTAHAAGVIHRDLKPANVMVFQQNSHETARVLDFGIATAIRAGKNVQSDGKFLGSPHYMPPEQFLNEELGFYTDTYSVGVILYECLTGQKPYPGRTAQEVYNELKRRPIVPPEQLNPALAAYPNLNNVICRALERNPDLRYPSAKEFFADLKGLLETLVEPVQQPAAQAPPIAAAARRRRSNVILQQKKQTQSSAGVIVGVSAAVAIVSLVLVFVLNSGNKNSGKNPPDPAPNKEISRVHTPPVNPVTPVVDSKEIETPPPTPEKEDLPKKENPPPPAPDPEKIARERAENLIADAAKLALSKEWNKVLELSREAISIKYDDARAHRLKGMAELELGMFEEALVSLQDARKRISPDKVDVNLLLLILKAQEGRTTPDQAEISRLIGDALDALQRDPENQTATSQILSRLDRLNMADEAIILLKHAKARNWSDPTIDALQHKYFVALPKERENKARELLQKAQEAFQQEDFAQAEEVAEQGYQIKPLPELGFLLAETYLSQEKPGEMQPILGGLAKTTKAPEELARVGTLYGRSYIKEYGSNGQASLLKKAIQNLDAAIGIINNETGKDLDHLEATALTYRARCYSLQGDPNGADQDIRICL